MGGRGQGFGRSGGLIELVALFENAMKKFLLAFVLLMPCNILAESFQFDESEEYADKTTRDICTGLMPDIAKNYRVKGLELQPFDNPYINKTTLTCTYRAVTHDLHSGELSRDRVVTVLAFLDVGTSEVSVQVSAF